MKYRKSIIYSILAAVFILVAILLTGSVIYDSYLNNGETLSLGKGIIKYIIAGIAVIIIVLIILFLRIRSTPPKTLNGSANDVKINFKEYDINIKSEVVDLNEVKRINSKNVDSD